MAKAWHFKLLKILILYNIKNIYMKKKIWALVILLVCSITGFSQSKSNKHLFGEVVDQTTQKSIAFANIVVKGTTTGTKTDSKGYYFLKDLPAGKFTLLVSAIGYKEIEKEIDLTSVDRKEINFELAEDTTMLKNVIVSARRLEAQRMGELSAAIQPTTVITPQAIFLKNADNFSQAVAFEPGVCVLTGCSSCGFKQIQINGLGASQTTMLIDGLPLYTDVTNFYGVDALTTAGIASIDIARGPGSSLLAPGALGGSIDVRFQDPTKNSVMSDVAAGNDKYSRLSVVATAVSDSGKLGIIVAAHHFVNGPYDALHTGMSQSPYMLDESALARINGWAGAKDQLAWNLRYTHSYNEVFGASTTTDFQGATIGPPDSLATQMFVGGNVNNKFIGNPIDILEWIQTYRDEGEGTLILHASKASLLQLHAGFATQSQNSMYEGGADYANIDHTIATDLRWQTQAGPHTITLGVDVNTENMKSQSQYYYVELGITPDSYNSSYGGGYLQDVWNFGTERDLSVAVRADRIHIDWIDKPNSAINKFIVAPRASFRWQFTEDLTGRLSAGVGWRAPLTFFELDHGLLDDGFDIGVTELEKGIGGGGSLSWTPGLWTFTGSIYPTWITGLEYVGSNPNPNIQRPILLSDSTNMAFLDMDFEADRVVNGWLELGAGIAHQNIPNSFKADELVAAQETEVNGLISITTTPFTFSSDVQWVASRNLLPYGYGGQYNQFADGVASDPKLTTAPSYFVIDAKAVYHVNSHWDIYVGAENLLNYTQAGSAHDEPHYFDQDGNFNTSHIWGPLRGRQMYAGIRLKI
jgi:outer membrane receptor protein involved in Fe transport